MMKKMKRTLFNMLCLALVLSAMVFGMTGCGNRGTDRDGSNDMEDPFDSLPVKDDTDNKKPEKEQTGKNTLNNRNFLVEEDGSLVTIDENLNFVWYQDASDQSINYFGGPCEVYYGEDAYDYITRDYEDNGVYRRNSVFNFSEEKLAEFFDAAEEEPIYSKDNMICMIMYHEDFVVEDEYQEKLDDEGGENPTTYYWGFYEGETFLCYNIGSASLMTWIPVEENEIADFGKDEADERENKDRDDALFGGDASDEDGSYSIEVGSGMITIDVPEDAENVFAGTYTLSYEHENIAIEYGDSLCGLTDDALEALQDSYDIFSADSSDSFSNVEPTRTRVGSHNAYYCKVVNTYSDGSDYVYYCFLVDIGEENYLDVMLDGASDDLSEEKAFELADVKFW